MQRNIGGYDVLTATTPQCKSCNQEIPNATDDLTKYQYDLFLKDGFCGTCRNNPERQALCESSKKYAAEQKEKNTPKVLDHINSIENPQLIGKRVTVDAIISSTSISYVVPSQISGTVIEEDQDPVTVTPSIEIDDPVNISLVAVSEETKNHRLTAYFKKSYPNGKLCNREEIAHRTIYMVRVRPPVFTLEKQGDKIIDEKGYEYKYLELYVASNKPLTFPSSTLMRITGIPCPNPRTQKTTLLAYDVEFPEDNLSYSTEKIAALKAVFYGKSVSERLNWILGNWERYSHIFGRFNLATATLLGYFSPLHVQFNGQLQRGWVIASIIGDTTTGKSETVKQFSKLLKAGSVISAETASTVGLTATTFQIEKEGWGIEWGFLPLMDRKLLAIDGSHKLNASAWAALAEAERSGVLSIAKAAKNTTNARTRQIRIYNAVDLESDKYSTKSLSCFLYPVQAITTVQDKTSIARLDLAVFSDQRDVTAETINKKTTEAHDPLLENLSEVLKWSWGNKAKVEWTENAVTTLLAQSTELYKKFFYEAIPIVSIDVKHKIARLSVALAHFTLSTNNDFSVVTVTEEHIKTVIDFLTEEYSKAGLGILAQQQKFERLTPEDVGTIVTKIQVQFLKNPIDNLAEILRFIVIQNHTTNEELKVKFNLAENNQARPLIATLKTEGFLDSKRGYYPSPKLIEAYKVTEGFTKVPNLNGHPWTLTGLTDSEKDSPLLNFNVYKNLNQKNTHIGSDSSNTSLLGNSKNISGGSYSDPVKPVKDHATPLKNQENATPQDDDKVLHFSRIPPMKYTFATLARD